MIKRVFSTINKPSIIVTNNAWKKIEEISKTQKGTFLFSATSGGCNGFNYKLNILNRDEYNKILNTDYYKIKPTIIIQNDTNILVDPKSEMLLLGTTIDYIKEDYSKGEFENKFVFIPDKTLASSCGCGISFTPKM
jgi:iron-sulfur cluster assembly accessory protein